MNYNEKISKFSTTVLDSPHFQHIAKSDKEDIIILAKIVFNDELALEDYDFIGDILSGKYLKEAI